MLRPRGRAALLPLHARARTALVLFKQLSRVVFKMSVGSILHFHETEVQLPVEGSTKSLG